MFLYVYDNGINNLGLMEKITSLIWTERKYAHGDFKLLCPATAENINLLQTGRYVVRDDNLEQFAELLFVQIRKDVTGAEVIEATGKALTHWTKDRLVLPAIDTTAKPQVLMQKAVTDNLITPTVPARAIPLLYSGLSLEDILQIAIDYKSEEGISVEDLLFFVAAATDTGFRIRTDIAAKRHYFDTYTGRDLSDGNAARCLFSTEFDNILEQEFTQSTEDVKTVAYVYGEKDDATGAIPSVSVGGGSGHARKEVFIDGSGIKREELTEYDYLAKLAELGQNELNQRKEIINFACKLNTYSNLIYGVDYRLGDKVTCLSRAWGVIADVTITEIETSYEGGKIEIRPTFGNSLPTLISKLKKL